MLWRVGLRARANMAADRAQPWVVPVLVVLVWMVWWLSVHRVVVGWP